MSNNYVTGGANLHKAPNGSIFRKIILPDNIGVTLWVDSHNSNMVAIQPQQGVITVIIQKWIILQKGPRLRYAVVEWKDLDSLTYDDYATLEKNGAAVVDKFPTDRLLELYGHNSYTIRAV